jgi:hypothetical protein
MRHPPIPSFPTLFLLTAMIPFTVVPARSLWMWGSTDHLPQAALVGFRDTSVEDRLPARLRTLLQGELEGTGKWHMQTGSRVDSVLGRIAISDTDCTDSCMESLGRSLDASILFIPHLTRDDGATHLTLMEIHLDSQLVMDRADAELGEPRAGTLERLARLVVERIAENAPATSADSGSIQVSTSRSNKIWIDGSYAGHSPLIAEVWPGEHRVSVVPDPEAGAEDAPPPVSDLELEPMVSFDYLWIQPAHGYRERHWRPSSERSSAMAPSRPTSSSRPSHGNSQRSGDDAGAVVAGVAVAAIGIGLLAAAAAQPDSVWDRTYQDVTVRAGDTVQVAFRRTSTGSAGLRFLGVVMLIFGVVLAAAVASSQH